MYYTNVICSHRSFLTTRYWIVYSRHEFQGQYIIIPPGACVRDLREKGLWSVGSALKCVKINQDNYNFYCHRPRITWLPNGQFPQGIPPFGPQPIQNPFGGFHPINYRGEPNKIRHPKFI
ncbi:unnamed protein product [Schistosoma mattheei]|uniref:Interleukin-4 inducing immunoglobulin-binding domain-containing protein n=1 Tax=Schistosoma mattheei TaxID=31246 RepID=A0AA85B2S1_9TREM|nr:unnamed protein product [Schistosoma mattheei]